MIAAVKLVLASAAASLLPTVAIAQDEAGRAMPWDVPGHVAAPENGPEVAELPDVADDFASSEAEVALVVSGFMDGLAAKDAVAMSALALDTAYLAFVRPGEQGDAARTMPLANAIIALAETVPEISEPIRETVVMVDGPVAMVWAPYDFYVDGEHSHCGVNIFSLLRRDDNWRIASVVYSYLPENCPQDTGEDTQ
ncbi:nuclear transport factor 2 family protein [Erythrobacter alti]|uniref:nuclear transport factor 2 family protein n=1 Tax=Erythrobacter alti TaxID=1896145 RepID=UPI0030F4697E